MGAVCLGECRALIPQHCGAGARASCRDVRGAMAFVVMKLRSAKDQAAEGIVVRQIAA